MQSEFARKASDSEQWLDSARSLLSTAQLLEPKIHSLWETINKKLRSTKHLGNLPSEVIQHQNVYLMLCAYCLENLMKSGIVDKNQTEIQSLAHRTGLLPTKLKTHDLLKLAGACSLDLTDPGKALLRRLTRHAKWIGRYPLGTSINASYDLTPSKAGSLESGWFEAQISAVNDLIHSIAFALDKNMSRGGTLTGR